jgi:phosphonate degradation associated HDIG domain protein
MNVVAHIEQLFAERGSAEYHGEAVSQLEHALQAATFAEAEGQPAAVIAAALLHDIGHLLHAHGEGAAERGIDDRHEELGGRFLAKHFPPAVTEPVRLHVPAKRYLCATEPEYLRGLSPASVRSLGLQGGPMTMSEQSEFVRHAHYTAAVCVRRYDDRAKIVGLQTPPLTHFLPYLEVARAG